MAGRIKLFIARRILMVKSWIGDGGENLKAYFLLIVSV